MGSSSRAQLKSKTRLKNPKTSSRCPTSLRPRKSSRRPPWSKLLLQLTAKTLPRQGSLPGRGRGLQRPDGRLPEVHGGIEGGGGLGHLLLAVAPSANIHPDFYHCIYSFQHLLYIHADY